MTVKLTKEQISNAIENSASMNEAASMLKIQFSTFKRHAIMHNLYSPNQGGKGKAKPKSDGNGKIPLLEILDGKHPQYQTFKLKLRLIDAGLKENKCECCGIDSWNGSQIKCELDHIDGDRTNHRLHNLRMLCPNCHSQTDTFRSKKRNARVVEWQTQRTFTEHS